MTEPCDQIVHDHYVAALESLQEQLEALDARVQETAKEPDYAPMVGQLCVLRGIDVLSAMIIVSELGDLRRFTSREPADGRGGAGTE